MKDIVFIATVVAFFALMTLLVVACDRIIGPDSESDLAIVLDEEEAAGTTQEAAA